MSFTIHQRNNDETEYDDVYSLLAAFSLHQAYGETFYDPYLTIIGDRNFVYGRNCIVIGDNNTMCGPNSEAIGSGNIVSGPNSRVTGNNDNDDEDPDDEEEDDEDSNSSTTRNNRSSNSNSGSGYINGELSSTSTVNTLSGDETGTVVLNGADVNNTTDSVPREATSRIRRNPFRRFSLRNMTTSTRTNVVSNTTELAPAQVPLPASPSPLASPSLSAAGIIKVPTLQDGSNDSPEGPNDAGTCIICTENKAICTALPCGHLSYCIQCARGMCLKVGRNGCSSKPKRIGKIQCAVCRTDVHEMKRLYF